MADVADDQPLKSAYELAMERLRDRDREQGAEESRALTGEDKAEIARLRQEATAKIAELEILHRQQLYAAAAAGDPKKLEELEERHRIDRGRVESALETAIARVRRGQRAKPD
jgi:hypothetical protein